MSLSGISAVFNRKDKMISPAELTPNVDTRQVSGYESGFSHSTPNHAGTRVKVRGTIDSDETLRQLADFAGRHVMNDSRSQFNATAIDDLLTRRI
jgi:hypothetical protein